MADDNQTAAAAPAPSTAYSAPLNAPLPAPRRSAGGLFAGILVAFVLGFGVAGWIAWQNGVDVHALVTGQPQREAAAANWTSSAPAAALGTVEGRVAALELRLSALDRQAAAAAANAGRAEALLIAFATRRAVERGAPLGYLEDQLKVRFGDALPNAVGTITTGARTPVTLDQLALGLDEIAAEAAGNAQQSGWQKVRQSLSGLFVIHNAPTPAPTTPADRVAHARLLLREGRTADAIAEVRALPLPQKDRWLTAAQRYQDLQRALDLLETTALVEPRELGDSAGQKIVVPQAPTPAPAPSPTAAPTP